MDKVKLADYLIKGILIVILKASSDKHNIAWILQGDALDKKDKPITIFWTFFQKKKPPFKLCVGGGKKPLDTIDNNQIKSNRKQDVIDYLVTNFGLSQEQSENVVNKARKPKNYPFYSA